jgi:hypothetical protein
LGQRYGRNKLRLQTVASDEILSYLIGQPAGTAIGFSIIPDGVLNFLGLLGTHSAMDIRQMHG